MREVGFDGVDVLDPRGLFELLVLVARHVYQQCAVFGPDEPESTQPLRVPRNPDLDVEQVTEWYLQAPRGEETSVCQEPAGGKDQVASVPFVDTKNDQHDHYEQQVHPRVTRNGEPDDKERDHEHDRSPESPLER